MEVRFTFRSEVYIKADTIDEAREKFEAMPLLSYDALEHYGDVVEVYDDEIVEYDEPKKEVEPMTREKALEVLRSMTIEECIEMWNEACRRYDMLSCIFEIDDEDAWSYVMSQIRSFFFVRDLLSSREGFNLTDRWFFYDEGCNEFKSFSTKQEMLELGIEEFFVEEIINRI